MSWRRTLDLWRKEKRPAEKPKTYAAEVQDLWDAARDNAMIAGMTLSTMPMDREPIRLHCLLTMSLIREVERLKAELREER